MNGATADPLVSTSSAPKIAMTISTGSSQNFLRTRRNPQNSPRKAIMSVLPFEGFRRRTGRLAREPVALGLRFEATPERIVPELPHQEADRHDAAEENEAENDRADD